MEGLKKFLLLLCLPVWALAQTDARRLSAPGALLSDHDLAAPGTMTVTLGAYYGRVSAGFDRALPAGDVSIGLTKRLDLGISGSLTKNRFGDFGTTAPGDSYISARLLVIPEGDRRPALTFEPVLEVLGRPSLANNALAPNKVNGVFGGIVGKSFDHFRIYNHSGYFTRGIFFSSAAVEFNTLFKRVTPVVYCTFGTLTANRDAAAERLNNSSQANLGGTLGFRISDNWSGYVSGSRGIGRRDLNTADFQIGGGISYTLRLWEPK